MSSNSGRKTETGGLVAKVPEADQPTEINGCAQSLCMLKCTLVKHKFLETDIVNAMVKACVSAVSVARITESQCCSRMP